MINIIKDKNALTNLLYINVAVFVFINVLKVFNYLFQNDIDISLVTRQPIFRTRKSFIESEFPPNGSLSATKCFIDKKIKFF